MKVKIDKELTKCTGDELRQALEDAATDVYFSDGNGLDWANASRMCDAIVAEARKRGFITKRGNWRKDRKEKRHERKTV